MRVVNSTRQRVPCGVYAARRAARRHDVGVRRALLPANIEYLNNVEHDRYHEYQHNDILMPPDYFTRFDAMFRCLLLLFADLPRIAIRHAVFLLRAYADFALAMLIRCRAAAPAPGFVIATLPR